MALGAWRGIGRGIFHQVLPNAAAARNQRDGMQVDQTGLIISSVRRSDLMVVSMRTQRGHR